MKVEEAKELEMDESELLDLLDFDDDMWFGLCFEFIWLKGMIICSII